MESCLNCCHNQHCDRIYCNMPVFIHGSVSSGSRGKFQQIVLLKSLNSSPNSMKMLKFEYVDNLSSVGLINHESTILVFLFTLMYFGNNLTSFLQQHLWSCIWNVLYFLTTIPIGVHIFQIWVDWCSPNTSRILAVWYLANLTWI